MCNITRPCINNRIISGKEKFILVVISPSSLEASKHMAWNSFFHCGKGWWLGKVMNRFFNALGCFHYSVRRENCEYKYKTQEFQYLDAEQAEQRNKRRKVILPILGCVTAVLLSMFYWLIFKKHFFLLGLALSRSPPR